MIPWWWLILALLTGGVLSWFWAANVYASGEAWLNKAWGLASTEEKKVINAIKSRMP